MDVCPDFLTEEEKKFVESIRQKFSNELTSREAEGKAYPCFFGSVALARILAAVEGNVEKAEEWFETLLQTLSDQSTEILVQDVLNRFGALSSERIDGSILPHYDTVKDFFNVDLCASKLSPDGDVIMYMPLVDLDRDGILEHLDWDHWVTFSRACTVLHCAILDKISEKVAE